MSRYKLTEQLVHWIASRLDAGDDSSTFAVGDAAAMLRTCFPDLTQRVSEVLREAIIGKDTTKSPRRMAFGDDGAQHLQRILNRLGAHSQQQAILKTALALVNATDGLA